MLSVDEKDNVRVALKNKSYLYHTRSSMNVLDPGYSFGKLGGKVLDGGKGIDYRMHDNT